MNNFTIIVPYMFENEIAGLKQHLYDCELEYDVNLVLEEDKGRIGSDLMYEKLWNKCSTDIFIMHADMLPHPDCLDWVLKITSYVKKYPKAGLFGCKLLYPSLSGGKHIIQSAGGRFTNGHPDHFGSGLNLLLNKQFKSTLEIDEGQYDFVREVAWTTFGGVYIRRAVLNDVGNFDPQYEWSYNRDVDYCLEARKAGWKVYQIPVPIMHFESKDNNRLRYNNTEYNNKETRNLEVLKAKWADTSYYQTIDKKVEDDK